jgi:hypothetical protein
LPICRIKIGNEKVEVSKIKKYQPLPNFSLVFSISMDLKVTILANKSISSMPKMQKQKWKLDN